MPDQRLSPRVENAEDTDLCTEVAWIRSDLSQRGRTRLQEPGVQLRGVAIGQRQERMRQREDDMYIGHIEELTLPGAEPAVTGLGLTLRAVAIPTGVIGDGLMAAGVTLVDVAAESRRATAHDRAKDRSLLHTQPRMLLDKGVTLRVEDIGHLHGGPAHDCGGLRRRRDRGRTTGAGTCSCSRGFGAACRCRRERCR